MTNVTWLGSPTSNSFKTQHTQKSMGTLGSTAVEGYQRPDNASVYGRGS